MSRNVAPSLLQHVRRLAATASSDEQLLAEFLGRRSEDAFSALIGRHGPMVLNVCRRILHDTHTAEDVFQATFLVLADRAGAIRRPTSLPGFLHGVAYRLAVRARRPSVLSLSGDVCDNAVEPSDRIAWKEMLGILDHELNRLPDQQRAPLVLCCLEGRTQDEAARQLGWSLNTLRRRLAQGRRLLEMRLRGRGVSLPSALAGVLAAGAVAVPGVLRAATLAAISAQAAGGMAASASAFSIAGKGISVFLATSGRRLAAVVLLVLLGTAVCYGWALHANQAPPPDDALFSVAQEGAADPTADPLPAQGKVRLGTARYRYGTRIESMSVSADGRLAAVSSGHGLFTGLRSPAGMFDLKDGRCLYTLPIGGDGAVEAVAVSPDGKILATKDSKFLTFHDAATGKELRKLNFTSNKGGSRSLTDWMTFSPDGKTLAVTLMDHAVQLVDVETAKVARTVELGAAASAFVFSADGKLMAEGGYDQQDGIYSALIFDAVTGKELRRIPAGTLATANGVKRALAFSPDGTMLAGGGWGEAKLRLWDVATGKDRIVFPKLSEEIVSVAFAPDGKTIAAAADQIHLFDAATGKERHRIERRARGLAFSQDGAVLTGFVSGAIYRWDAATGRQLTPVAAHDSAVEQILVSADGKQVFTTDQDGGLFVWDAAGAKAPRRIADGITHGIVMSADRRFLAWTGLDKYRNSRIRLHDIAANRIIDRFPVHAGIASVAAFLPDGKSLLTLEGGPPTFRLWDIETGKQQRSFTGVPPKSVGNPGMRLAVVPFCTPRRATLSPDGRTLAIGPDFPDGVGAGDSTMPVHLWDVETGKAGRELNQPMSAPGSGDDADDRRPERLGRGSHPQMKSMDGRAFSPDGRLLVDWAEHPDGRSRIDHVHVWDAATGRAVATLAAGQHSGAANVAFAPDGRTLAVASADGAVRLWEVATWKVRAEFRGHRGRVTALAFGPDGRLFTGGLDTTVLAWEVLPPVSAAKGTLADAWEALAKADAKAGFEAQGRFLAEPGKAVAWLAARVAPAVQPAPARMQALIADLANDDFATRARSTAELKELWPATEAALRSFLAKTSTLEAHRRAEGIIREMEQTLTPSRLRDLRVSETLEWIATEGSLAHLRNLAKGAPGSPLTRDAAAAYKRLGGS